MKITVEEQVLPLFFLVFHTINFTKLKLKYFLNSFQIIHCTESLSLIKFFHISKKTMEIFKIIGTPCITFRETIEKKRKEM